jgi:hypothetical protein
MRRSEGVVEITKKYSEVKKRGVKFCEEVKVT